MTKRFSWVVLVAAGVSAAVGMLVAAGVAYAVVPTLSQTNVIVGLGKTLTVTSENNINVYLGLNPSPVTASVSVSGTQITITGEALGSTELSICAVGTASDCANLNVTVQTASVSAAISLSPSSLSLATSSSQSVAITGGNGTYTVSSNSNTSVASASLSGSALTISGIAAGSTTITVCDTANTCGTLSVTVNAAPASGLSFNPNNISLAPGANQAVTISGGNGNYSITNNSNGGAIYMGTSGATITVYATAPGNALVTVCDTTNTCGTLSVTVTGGQAGNQTGIFSVANPTLAIGQSLNVGLSGAATGYVVGYNASPDIVQANVTNGVTLALTGVSAGTDTLSICALAGACSPFSVMVTGSTNTTSASASATTTAADATATAVATPTVAATVVPITAQAVQSGTIAPNATLLTEIQALQTALTQILTQVQSMETQLSQLEAQVNAGSGSGAGTNVSASAASSGTSYNFTELLTVGSQDAEVTALQNRLATLGFYSGPITGYYGTLTQQAVMKYQVAHGVAATGYTGPSTRAALNAGN